MPSREAMIQALLQDWRSSLREDATVADTILQEGFVGYRHMLDSELVKACEDAGIELQ